MALRSLPDRVAALVTAALVLVLGAIALSRLPGADLAGALRADDAPTFLTRASPAMILAWCLVSVPLAAGLWRSKRWALGSTAALNALYLAVSLAGSALFGIAMHAALLAFAAVRLARP
jgi:hypothetical protein